MTEKDAPKTEDLLRSVPYFSGLNAKILQDISRVSFQKRYTAGQIIQIEGQPSPGLYIIASGFVKVIKINQEGREQILNVLGPGDIYNVISVFTAQNNPATIEAMEEVIVQYIPRETFLDLFQEHSSLALAVVQALTQRMQDLVKLVEDISLRTVESRLAHKILTESENGVLHRQPWATQGEMAAHLGTVTDVLNRALRDLSGQGLIEVNRKNIQILDREGLEKRARP